MVTLAPFRALRYNLDRIDLSTVVAPPYDVISPADQESLYARSPYNIVRLILGKQSREDTHSSNCYTRARDVFSEWRRTNVLIRDDAPAVYLYEHAFTWQGQRVCRLGCVALLVFDGSVPEGVLHHEATFAAPKADRTRLLEAVPANLSPVFFVYDDPSGQIHERMLHASRTLAPLATAPISPLPTIPPPAAGRTGPALRAVLPLAAAAGGGTKTTGQASDEVVRIWAIREPEVIRDLTRRFAEGRVLIADGHHRFSVAVSKRQQFGAVMGFFSWMEDPAVRVRPIHRVITVAPDGTTRWDTRLKTLCHVQPASSLEQLTKWLANGTGQGRFGYYQDGRFAQVSVQEDVLAKWLLHPPIALPLAGLDVVILHELLLPQLRESLRTPVLAPGSRLQASGEGPQPPAPSPQPPQCHYTPYPDEAIAMVDGRQGDCAWFLRPLPLPQVFALASQGLTLPQKTTYFYPKLLSGLFINPF
ncbi:MAG: DUF1015 domain-containing protein [Candidatus Omnitrophica bacterium]|nr:DUF1015 domain-containing protein [Candidatus Omnitrophota bacterium]